MWYVGLGSLEVGRVVGVGCDAVWKLCAPPPRRYWVEVGQGVLGVGVVEVCCKPKEMCGVVAILGVSCQLNTMTRTLLRVLKKKSQFKVSN